MKDSTPITSDTQKSQKHIRYFRILFHLIFYPALLIGWRIYIDPPLLGCACGPPSPGVKAKAMVGAVHRAQQSYYKEYQQFAQTFDDLEKTGFSISDFNGEYYVFGVLGGKHQGIFVAYGINNQENGTRDYIGGINFNIDKKEFNTIMCRINNQENDYRITNPHTAIINYGEVSNKNYEIKCNEGEEVK